MAGVVIQRTMGEEQAGPFPASVSINLKRPFAVTAVGGW